MADKEILTDEQLSAVIGGTGDPLAAFKIFESAGIYPPKNPAPAPATSPTDPTQISSRGSAFNT